MILKQIWFHHVFRVALGLAFLMVIAFLGLVAGIVFWQGRGVLSWSFLTQMPRNGMTEGGIAPIIVGTVLVTCLSAVAAIPLAIMGAVYLSEYAQDGWYSRLIKSAVQNLAAVPSIVYGLFGLAIFVKSFHFGTSALSAGLTLGLMSLPTMVTAAYEAIRNVPRSHKDGAFALGLTKWQVLRTNVIPEAIPGIITGIILGLSRAMGETAPILFTGVAFYIPASGFDITQQFMALPYHLYIMSTQHHDIEGVRGIAYATAAVLLMMSLLLNGVASSIRFRFRSRSKA